MHTRIQQEWFRCNVTSFV